MSLGAGEVYPPDFQGVLCHVPLLFILYNEATRINSQERQCKETSLSLNSLQSCG